MVASPTTRLRLSVFVLSYKEWQIDNPDKINVSRTLMKRFLEALPGCTIVLERRAYVVYGYRFD
jgi:hypothetical protein